MTSSNNAPASARERARQANAQRLADAQMRLKNQEQDLISYFDATRDEEKVTNDLANRIERLQRDAQTKLEDARHRRSDALAVLKSRGETYSNIATLVGLPVPETTKLIKSAATSRSRAGVDGNATSSNLHSEKASADEGPAVGGPQEQAAVMGFPPGEADERGTA